MRFLCDKIINILNNLLLTLNILTPGNCSNFNENNDDIII